MSGLSISRLLKQTNHSAGSAAIDKSDRILLFAQQPARRFCRLRSFCCCSDSLLPSCQLPNTANNWQSSNGCIGAIGDNLAEPFRAPRMAVVGKSGQSISIKSDTVFKIRYQLLRYIQTSSHYVRLHRKRNTRRHARTGNSPDSSLRKREFCTGSPVVRHITSSCYKIPIRRTAACAGMTSFNIFR